ncbi:ABC transporter permease [Cryobacterium sp. N21]|uniref:ABC transporter permease n=1 Tax=Cryobacterium sp. N21 TaxID=2048289 RepID=UPI0018EBDE01|nr:ABC transporter permease subunit [Cryobacterium sp. N21]
MLGQALVAVCLAALWQIGVAASPQFGASIPTFTDTGAALVRELAVGTLWLPIGQTLLVTASGVVICLVIGIPVGLLLASHPFLTISTRFLIDFCRTVPPLAVIPLFLLFLGPTPQMSIALIVAVGVWPILLQTIFGVRNVDPELLSTARSFRMPLHRRLLFVVAPASMPYIFTGIRISATLSLLLAIGAELIAGVPGLGREILLSQQATSDRMFALIIVAGALGMVLAFSILALEKRLLAWHFVPRASAL